MKKIIASLIFTVSAMAFAQARETITVVIPAAPTQSSTPVTQKTVDKANELQNKYNFVVEFKPGGNGTVGMKYMDASPMNRIVGIAPAFIENSRSGLVNENDYVPIYASGDVCWAVITNVGDAARGIESLADYRGKEITVGGTGYGNAAHITSLMLAEKYGFKVKYVVFKSNFDAVVNMVGNNGINLALESIGTYRQFKDKQPKLQMLGFNCPTRSTQAPDLKTMREQGIDSPTIWNITVANRAMPESKRKEIGDIFNRAIKEVGAKEYADTAGLYPPVFRDVSIEQFAKNRIERQKSLVEKYANEIEASK